jgi:hypothetical protein
MDQNYAYDLEPWYVKRKLLWKAIQLPGDGSHAPHGWRDHTQLYKLLQNADQYALHIVREEVNCRRLKKQTTRHRKLIKTFEETTKLLEDQTVMFRLMYSGR